MANSQEYGFFQLLDLGLLNPNAQARVNDSGLMQGGILYDVARHNADIDALLRTFAVTTTEYTEEIDQQGSSRNQPLDQHGRSLPIKPAPPYTVAYPIQGSGNAVGMNFVTSQLMTNRDLAKQLSNMYRGDYAWVRDHVWGALFNNANYNFRDPTGKGNLVIRGPANGDATTYFSRYTNLSATDNHFIAQNAAIADNANPFSTLKSELLEHPDNDGEVIAFVSSSLIATTTGLAEFYTADLDPDISQPSDEARLSGVLGVTLPPNGMLKGKTESGVWIVEQTDLPSGYIVGITTAGKRPLARRQYPSEALQGFKPQGEREDFPYFETQWGRWEGYGAHNRTGAVIIQIGSASYAVPTGYAMPMP